MSEFLESRIEYLEGLTKLAPGWISDGYSTKGETPDPVVVEFMVMILRDMDKKGIRLDQETLLMAPLIEGGVGIEVKTKLGTALLAMYNSGEFEVFMAWYPDELDIGFNQTLDIFIQELTLVHSNQLDSSNGLTV